MRQKSDRTRMSKTLFKNLNEAKILAGCCLLAAALAFFIVPTMAYADEVLMKNGDRISGEIKTLGKGKLTVKTPFDPELIKLDWASVKGVVIVTPSEIVLEDGTKLKGTTEVTETGELRILTETAGPILFPDCSKITGINPPPEITYKGDVQAAASLTSGNSDTTNVNLSANFVSRSKRQRLTLRGGWRYGENKDMVSGEDEVSAEEANGSIKYDFFLSKRIYTYVNSTLEYNLFQDLNLRSTVGGGLGYQILEDDRTNIYFELGVSFLNEDFMTALDEKQAAGRWSVNAIYNILPGRIELFHFHEGFLGLEDTEDLYLRTEQGIRLTLLKNFFTTFQANITYDKTPAEEAKKTDTALLFGLGYSFDL
ncbi:YdiY family protein [Thermodesulfobacteriota bacterium]